MKKEKPINIKELDAVEIYDWHTLKELPEAKIRELREKLKIGSDIDGVICYYEIDKKDYRPFRLHEYHSLAIPSKYSGMPVDVFITGRRKCYWRTTLKWFKANGIKCKFLVMFPPKIKKNKKTFDQYKGEVINLLELDKYHEDDERAVNSLRESCPNTEIILVNDAKPLDSEPANQINEDSKPIENEPGFKLRIDPELDNLFRYMPKEVYDSIKEDIKRDGILDDLKVDKAGFILDGMKRFKIAKEQDIPEKDIPYRVMYFENELDRMNFAIKHNIDRKSPDSYQRARAVLLTEPLYKEEAKLRQGSRTDLQPSEGGKFGETREIMAKIAHVSKNTINRVKLIETFGTEEEKRKGVTGEKSISELYELVSKRKAIDDKITKGESALEIVSKEFGLEIITVDYSQLKFNPYNPNVMTENMYEKLGESIQKYGYIKLILTMEEDGKYFVIDGEKRAKKLHELGRNKFPVIVCKNFNKLMALAGSIAFNRVRGRVNPQKGETSN